MQQIGTCTNGKRMNMRAERPHHYVPYMKAISHLWSPPVNPLRTFSSSTISSWRWQRPEPCTVSLL